MLTTFIDHDRIARALRAGAVGFVLKDTGPEELIMAVRAAAHGHAILAPQVARRITDAYLASEPARASHARHLLSQLTEREREVLVLIGLGLSNADAARRLYLGEATVKTHVSHILTKLGCQNRVQAAIVAHDAGILGRHLAQTTDAADTRAAG
jgi:DNA-binding NarL/FixJ family response regulator